MNLEKLIKALSEENKQLSSKLKNSKLQVLKLLIKIVEEVDPYTKGHSLKVYRYAIRIAAALRLSRKAIRSISKAALLHDIGKIALDREVLNKKE